ncbi:MAG: chorismate lyase [Oceanospirillaceae bacterium]|nr:chorismate lyase [Oceanospirillaceae bacterium]MCP5334709.1 chorismate lyase [Oceanospirillaceae bacterium]MCP5351297.1 chorismate lyase [Oceanospirillaceae bacterium]
MLKSLLPASFRQQPWVRLRKTPSSMVPFPERTLVLNSGSLTQALKALARHSFGVDVKFTGYGQPTASEAMSMGIDPRQRVYLREVQLLVDGQVCVVARSVIPLSTLSGREKRLLRLGSKPLGEYLFAHPQMRRGPLELKIGAAKPAQPRYARRSVFYLSGKPLMVSEAFVAIPPCRA